MPSAFCNEIERAGFEGIASCKDDAGLEVWPNGLGCNLGQRRAEIMATDRGLMVSLQPTKSHPDGFHHLVTETTNPWSAYEIARKARKNSPMT